MIIILSIKNSLLKKIFDLKRSEYFLSLDVMSIVKGVAFNKIIRYPTESLSVINKEITYLYKI